MKYSVFSALLILFTFWIAGGQCQSCAPVPSTLCAEVVPAGTSVYVPPGLTIGALQRYANSLINLLAFSAVPDPCHSFDLQLICGTWLRPCHQINNVSVPIPREPCLNLCNTYYNACINSYPFTLPTVPIGLGMYFPSGSPPLDCANPPIDTGAGNVTFFQPNATYVTSYNNLNYTVTCSNGIPIVPPALTYCQEPLVPAPTSRGTDQCAFACPLPSLSDDQYTNVKALQGVVGWFSWVTSCFLIILLLVYPKARAFPRNMIIMTACAANIAAGAIIMPTYAGYDETWCGGSDVTLVPSGPILGTDQYGFPLIDWQINETFLSVESSLCTFQGAMLQFGFLAAVFWWMLIAFNMALELFVAKIVALPAKWKWIRFFVYLVIGWGVPFVLMVIPAAAGRIKFVPAGTYCFVTNEDNYAWSLTFWFLPVGIALLVGVTLFLAALIRVTILLITIRKVKKLLVLYSRLLVFIFLYLAMFVFIFAYNIQVANNNDKISQGYSDYYSCLILGLGPDTCSLDDSISNYDLVMLKAWAISSLGTLLFFVFVSWDVLRFWGRLFKAVGIAIYMRDTNALLGVLSILTRESSRTSLHTGGSGTLSVSELPAGGHEEETGEDDEEMDVQNPHSDESSSSESSSEN